MEKNSNIEMNEEYGERILWKDRKRILGMPISFTKYEITEDRFICHKGFFRTEVNEILLYRVLDLKLVRTLGQKILGVGTTTCIPRINLTNSLSFRTLKSPRQFAVSSARSLSGSGMRSAYWARRCTARRARAPILTLTGTAPMNSTERVLTDRKGELPYETCAFPAGRRTGGHEAAV